jgi:hypothetical protein
MSTLRVDNITNEAGDGSPNFPEGIAIAFFFNATINTSDWTGSEPLVATITVSGIKATDRPIVDIDLSAVDFGDVFDTQNEWSLVYRVEASDDNELKFYATDEPTENFSIQIKVVR